MRFCWWQGWGQPHLPSLKRHHTRLGACLSRLQPCSATQHPPHAQSPRNGRLRGSNSCRCLVIRIGTKLPNVRRHPTGRTRVVGLAVWVSTSKRGVRGAVRSSLPTPRKPHACNRLSWRTVSPFVAGFAHQASSVTLPATVAGVVFATTST